MKNLFVDQFGPTAFGILIPILVVFGALIGTFFYGSCFAAKIYNQRNGTEYTCADFFWAGSQINSQTQTINLKTQ